jgi:hypothetical protein
MRESMAKKGHQDDDEVKSLLGEKGESQDRGEE